MRRLSRHLIGRIERALVRKYEFIRNVAYYFFDRKLTWKQSIRTARDTL